jgi:hypothetical protein
MEAKKQAKKTELSINDYYNSLDTNEKKRAFREKVINTLDIQFMTFYDKMRKRNWNKLQESALKQIVEEDAKGN